MKATNYRYGVTRWIREYHVSEPFATIVDNLLQSGRVPQLNVVNTLILPRFRLVNTLRQEFASGILFVRVLPLSMNTLLHYDSSTASCV